jgi:hypothetical protein
MSLIIAALLTWVPFPVGPPAPHGVHITVWTDTRAEGLAACREQLSWYGPGEAECRAEPSSMAPDVTQPGWAS